MKKPELSTGQARFRTLMRLGISQLGFIADADKEPFELAGVVVTPPLTFRGSLNKELLPFISFGTEVNARGFSFHIISGLSSPAVSRILATLQGSRNFEQIVPIALRNNYLTNGGRNILRKADHEDDVVSEVLESIANYDLPWFSATNSFKTLWQETTEIENRWGIASSGSNLPLKIAANLYLGEFEEALRLIDLLEKAYQSKVSQVCKESPNLPLDEVEQRVSSWYGMDRPNPAYCDKSLILRARKACELRDTTTLMLP